MTKGEFEKWLVEAHTMVIDQCEDSGEEECEAWQAFLKALDPTYESCSYECHWGDGGVFDYVQVLEEMVEKGERRLIVEDPEAEGSSTAGVLLFDPAVLQKTK